MVHAVLSGRGVPRGSVVRSAMPRRLKLRFEDATAFRDEYRENIVQGGAFVRTLDQLSLREAIVVEIELAFCGMIAELDAEVVHCVTAEETGDPTSAGVAVQFLVPASELRDRFERYANGRGAPPPRDPAQDPDAEPEPSPRAERRRGARKSARVPARLDAPHVSLEGRTRDLSEQGVLVSVDGSDLPVGKKVRLALVHPDTGRTFEVEGHVARRLDAPGTVAAVAIDLHPDSAPDGFGDFVRDVHAAEARRHARGISGAIEELGFDHIVQMFGKLTRGGTLTASSGAEEGVVTFENGCLRSCRLGSLSGTKALARMLSWGEGRFDFHAELDPASEPAAELVPLEGALLEAARQLDESRRLDPSHLDPAARLRLDNDALARCAEPLTKTEEAVVDLAAAGLTVRRLLDVIPESDAQILEAIVALAERGLVEIVGSE